ncbi:MAG: MaoC family dehydratase N-terminal domain-containing protein [bacterium]
MSKNNQSEIAAGILNDELINKMRGKIGLSMRLDGYINNEEVTKSAIRRFADGVGEVNPLWLDEDYAKDTRYGRLVAPPQWLWSVCGPFQFGWRGLAGFHSSTEQTFYKPVLLGDKISPEVIFAGFDEPKTSKFGGRTIRDYYDHFYRNQEGELVAKMRLYVHRVERLKIAEKKKEEVLKLPHPWTDEELKGIEDEAMTEEIRGKMPRYWEDVNMGDALKPLVKGPFSLMDMIAFNSAGVIGGRLLAYGAALRDYRKHPAWAYRDEDSCALQPLMAVHFSTKAARLQGLPYPYDVGVQRHCNMSHFLTNWMGDDGFLKRCYSEYRGFVYQSDVIHIKGKITDKHVDEDNDHCVDIEISTTNQRGQECMPGKATIALPSRDKGVWPLDGLLP